MLPASFTPNLSILLNLRTTHFRFWNWVRVASRYYTHSARFFLIDLLFARQYALKSPHRISKAFQKKRGAKNPYTFGETPLTTMDRIAKECRILSKHQVYELGCGSGRGCFWLANFVKCKVTGIDYLPSFIQKAEWIQKRVFTPTLHFHEGDMFETNLEQADFVYLYGTCLSTSEIKRLLGTFKTLKPKAHVISVSYPLTDYCSPKEFKLIKSFQARFPWGYAEVFLNQKTY